jgi:hypothetical protein
MKETDRRFKETDRKIQETDRVVQETSKIVQETSRKVAELSKNIGGLSNSFGMFAESFFSGNLLELFRGADYNLTKGGRNIKFQEGPRIIAEADVFLEDKTIAVPVEIKFALSREHVDEHLEQIKRIREYMDGTGDRRVLIGAVAGGTVNEDVCRYAHKKGLYVLVQSGDAAELAELPQNFRPAQFFPAAPPAAQYG